MEVSRKGFPKGIYINSGKLICLRRITYSAATCYTCLSIRAAPAADT